MPRGKTLLPDGTEVSIRSKQYRDYLESDPERATKLSKTPITFEPPEDHDRLPSASDKPNPKRRTPTKSDKHDDQLDFASIIGLSYAGIAGATKFDGWRISEEESLAIARPLQRILSRNKHLDRAIRQFVDPIALVTAVGVATVPRLAAYQHHRQLLKVTPPTPPTKQPQESPQMQAAPTSLAKASSPTIDRLAQGFFP